jgi:hypothetical protein
MCHFFAWHFQFLSLQPTVVRLAAEVGVKPEELCADGWAIGWGYFFESYYCLFWIFLTNEGALNRNVHLGMMIDSHNTNACSSVCCMRDSLLTQIYTHIHWYVGLAVNRVHHRP